MTDRALSAGYESLRIRARVSKSKGYLMPETSAFSVRLSGIQASRCNAVRGDDLGCREAPTLIAALAYCTCGEAHRAGESCGDGGHDMEPDRVPVCEAHGATIRSSWECFRRLTTYRPEQVA